MIRTPLGRVLFIALAASACLVVASPVQAALIAQYALDGSGFDSSGNGKHGTVYGAASTMDRFGQSDRALAFDGLDDYVDITQLLFNGNDATVAFWAKSTGSQNYYTAMVSQGHYHGSPGPISFTGFAVQHGWPDSSKTYLIYGDGTDNGWEHSLIYPVTLTSDTGWHHFAFTKLGSSVKIYFDGAFVNSISRDMVFGSYNFNIGRDTVNTDANHRTFNGAIDDLFVYNNALGADGILALYNSNIQQTVPEPGTLLALSSLMVSVAAFQLARRRRKI